jgi:hypothetical protein
VLYKSAGCAALISGVSQSRGQLAVEGFFSTGKALVAAGFDELSGQIWLYEGFNTVLEAYSEPFFSYSVLRPGRGANDADIDFNREEFTLGTKIVPANSLLFVDGEVGAAVVYAVDKQNGAVITSLQTAFGKDHVVGGAYHAQRNTIFLIADKLDGLTPNTIAEIDPITGAVLNSFGTASADYTINYGDLAITAYNGNLLLVSSDEGSIRELTPAGVFVRDIPLPAGVTSLSGIGVDDRRNQAILAGTGGTVWIVRGIYAAPVLNIHYMDGGQAEICWNGRTDRSYILQRRATLNTGGGWINYKTGIVGVSPMTCVTEAVTDTTYFYRVEEVDRQLPVP